MELSETKIASSYQWAATNNSNVDPVFLVEIVEEASILRPSFVIPSFYNKPLTSQGSRQIANLAAQHRFYHVRTQFFDRTGWNDLSLVQDNRHVVPVRRDSESITAVIQSNNPVVNNLNSTQANSSSNQQKNRNKKNSSLKIPGPSQSRSVHASVNVSKIHAVTDSSINISTSNTGRKRGLDYGLQSHTSATTNSSSRNLNSFSGSESDSPDSESHSDFSD